MIHGSSGTIGEINFNSVKETDFFKQLSANIPGINPEDVRFEQIEPTPYDYIVQLKISCDTKWSEEEYIGYSCVMKIDLREFYGFDYSVRNGRLCVTLYKTQKKDVQKLGFGFKFETKYQKQPISWV